MEEISVGIIGGSIAGCAMAIELSRIGCRITILERRGEELKDKGAGIGLPVSLLQELKDRDILDNNTKFFLIHSFPRIWKSDKDERFGYVAWKQPATMGVTNWSNLYKNFRKRIPENCYLTNKNVISINELPSEKVEVILSDNTHYLFDILVCADGYLSIGRNYLFPPSEFPASQISYPGYLMYRANIPESLVLHLPEGIEPLNGIIAWVGFPGGLAGFYVVPDYDNSDEKGKRRITCAIYQVFPEESLKSGLTDKYGVARAGSIPSGAMPDDLIADIKECARKNLPGYYADIIASAEDFSLQGIFDCSVPSHSKGRICLAGDAASLSRPHAGSGALKAITSATKLANALQTCNKNIPLALEKWSREVTEECEKQVIVGKQIGEALILKGRDWSLFDDESMGKWWAELVSAKIYFHNKL